MSRPPKQKVIYIGNPASELRSVLVPLDLTPASDRVLGRLLRLPLADAARVTLLHVLPSGLLLLEEKKAARDAQKALFDEAKHLKAELPKGTRVETRVVPGSAAKEIALAAATVQADLIVMGRGGGRALREAFLGSTAERVVRQAKRPVLVVRQPPRALYSRPAVALDLDPVASEVIRVLFRVLPSPRPKVDVIHAFDIPYKGLVYPSLSEDDAQERKDEHRAQASGELTKLLIAALAKARISPDVAPAFKPLVQYGSARLVVEKAIKKLDSDLLVLGTHGHSGAAYMFLGTVAGDLLRAARCDVLVVPPAPRGSKK